jgi:acyl carrier protein
MSAADDLTRDEIESVTKETLGDMLRLDPESIDVDDRLGEDLEFDSMDAVDLVVDLKMNLGIKFGKEDIKQVKTVGDIIEIASQKQQGGASETR